MQQRFYMNWELWGEEEGVLKLAQRQHWLTMIQNKVPKGSHMEHSRVPDEVLWQWGLLCFSGQAGGSVMGVYDQFLILQLGILQIPL